jgi:hypothetical protein
MNSCMALLMLTNKCKVNKIKKLEKENIFFICEF